MTLAFRTLLSQAANQMRALLTSAPPDWTAAEDASATISLLALEEEIAVNIEHSDALINEAARFEEGQRLFLSAFGKLPAGSKDAEQKSYDDLLNDIRVDDLQAECRQMISSLARRVRAYRRLESELRAQIAQAQARATTHVALDDNGSRDTSLLRDILQQNQQMMQQMMQQNAQLNMQNMQDMLQAFTLQHRPATPSVDDQHRPATPPAVSAVNSTASNSLLTTAVPVSEPPPTANSTLQSVSGPVSSAPGGPLPMSTASMPIYTTRNMGAQSTHSSHWTTPLGPGFGQQFGQHHAQPPYFSSPYVPPVQQPLQDDRFRLPLPKMQIPYFHGEKSKWRGFWQRFDLVISRHPELSDLEKLTLILGYLKGEAEKLVEGISITEGNYQIVVSLLKDAYDNREMIICGLYNDLQKLEPATSGPKLKEVYFQFSKICRQLEVEGEMPSHNPVLWKIVYDKLSAYTLRQIIPKKPVGGWTVPTLQRALKTVIDQEEEIAAHKGDKPKNTRQEKPQNDSKQNHTVLSAVAVQKKRPEPKWPCSFCQEKGHWLDACLKYPDYQTRANRAQELGYCAKCMRKGHSTKDCTNNPDKPRPHH
ncbi:Zinc knuckle family protein [Ditylenchus destructor]|uniref:Zinc knuckle family protein n=1 Tax=Ditylenchus destructor TaxID=166010 RepID=A0AAD4MSZ2_9BILA|nr:Zinc knuckle family protein [Ditylenchus destructor]